MARILIVDDSPSQLMGIRRIVEKLGHEALTAEDGAARVEAAKRGSSVSRLMGEWLAEKMRQEDAYAQAMREALAFETWGASSGPYVPRETLFQR